MTSATGNPDQERLVEYERLKQKEASSKGLQYMNRMQVLLRTMRLFNRNSQELMNLIAQIQDPICHIASGITKAQEDEKQAEIGRLLHNFLASAQTMVEHTRIYMRSWHLGSELYTQYLGKIGELFREDPLSKVIQDLRNYFLHRTLPPSIICTSMEVRSGRPPVIRIRFKTSELLEWDGWTALSRKYLESNGSHIDLQEIIHVYFCKVRAFHEWFDLAMAKAHRVELEEAAALLREWKEYERRYNANITRGHSNAY